MNDIAIKVEGLSKRYQIGRRERYKTIREKISAVASAPFRRLGGKNAFSADAEFWALQDVNFEINRGDVVGIIGRNGAGKSTLLKILSRITEPTEGCVAVYGRVGSLLEVGTGFHPELTGRENVYLNGAILGMKRAEITGKFDEIVAFAEIEKFLDTPVKHYSSGMYTRLAFAVAAHLEPEILLVDEVLAVGDAQFQKKCIGKMGDIAKQGRTVMFVSHNMTAVQSLCRSGILLVKGEMRRSGPAAEVIRAYLKDAAPVDREVSWDDPARAPGLHVLRIKRISVTAGRPDHDDGILTMKDPIRIETQFWVSESSNPMHITYHLINDQGITVLTTGCPSEQREAGVYSAAFSIPAELLNSGGYFLKLLIVENGNRVTYQQDGIASFEVVENHARQHAYLGREPGVVQPRLPWNVMPIDVSTHARE